MRAVHTDVFSVSPCCPGMARWDRREASVSRFKYLESVGGLPARPSAVEMTYGYVINGEVYVYVEEGGDTLNGLYQNCGAFEGPDGASAYEVAVKEGYEGTEEEWIESLHATVTIVNNLSEGGVNKALSAEQGKVLYKGGALLGEVVETVGD